jgi:CheY-like chemotaxis protein
MSYKILIVDDEVANLRLLERLFRREDDVISATSGAEALELLHLHNVATKQLKVSTSLGCKTKDYRHV